MRQNCDCISSKCVRSVIFQKELVQECAFVSSNWCMSVRGLAGIGSGVCRGQDEVG